MGFKLFLLGLLLQLSFGQCCENSTYQSPTLSSTRSTSSYPAHSSTSFQPHAPPGAPTEVPTQAPSGLPTHLNVQDRNLNTIQKIYNMSTYPNNQAFIANGSSAIPSGLFNENASGRITPIGNFTGFEDSVEYFFGLTPPPQAPVWDTWTSAKIVSYTSGCPEVASSVVYGTTTGVNPDVPETYGKYISTIKQIAFWKFDDQGAVLYYDAWFSNLNSYTTLLYGTAPNPAYDSAVIQALCTEAEALCTGNNTQYTSEAECVSTLSAKPFGEWDEVWGDNVVCRMLHILLAKLRPDVSEFHSSFLPSGAFVKTRLLRSTVLTSDPLAE
ncbi:hypothetical protein MMC26_000636 [Xylographa opegraphella]|nr:hypothetical protein [Xylographa opegraphella]